MRRMCGSTRRGWPSCRPAALETARHVLDVTHHFAPAEDTASTSSPSTASIFGSGYRPHLVGERLADGRRLALFHALDRLKEYTSGAGRCWAGAREIEPAQVAAMLGLDIFKTVERGIRPASAPTTCTRWAGWSAIPMTAISWA